MMKRPTLVMAATAAAVVLATAGVGLADGSEAEPTEQPTMQTAPDDATGTTSSAGRQTVDAAPAGAVHYIFTDVLAITDVDVASGWRAETEEARGAEIEVVFTNGVQRIDVEVEIEDGAPRERVRERALDGDRSSGSGRDDDRSGRDHPEDDDRSGRDHPEDDDRPGRDHPEDD